MSKYRDILSTLGPGVTLLAVSKTKPYEDVKALYEEGARLFGENRVQEIEEKFPSPDERPEGMKIFMIGHLQKNKVKKAVALADRIESVDSLELLEKIDSEAGKINKKIDILLEWKSSDDENKSGFDDETKLMEAVCISRKLSHVNLLGLMTIGPLTDDKERVRSAFRETKVLFDKIGGLSVLSMGMSGDYDIAIEEGSTEVRIGTLLFGRRG